MTGTGTGTVALHCTDCGDERSFEQPPCSDGHGLDCPERCCVDCGAAVFVGPVPPDGAEAGLGERDAA
ncbi:MAG: hypothetical protein ACRDPK_14605 [Carbonactinosporaceae bacterium]